MSEKYTQQWIAPKNIRLPDFIICGAMKCGTSTVHTLLGKHPETHIPDREINFFDIDDIFQHSDFYSQRDGRFLGPDISIDPIAYGEWYHDFFAMRRRAVLLEKTRHATSPQQEPATEFHCSQNRLKQ